MSRLFAIIVSCIHMAGGLLTGYYAYAYRVAVENAGEGAVAFDINWLTVLGPGLIVLAFVLHLSQVFRARRVDRGHTAKEETLKKSLELANSTADELRLKIADDEQVLRFCRIAIAEAAERSLPGSPSGRDFPELEELDLYDDRVEKVVIQGGAHLNQPGDGPEIVRQVEQPKDYSEHTEGK